MSDEGDGCGCGAVLIIAGLAVAAGVGALLLIGFAIRLIRWGAGW
jgi:hypothetical protein